MIFFTKILLYFFENISSFSFMLRARARTTFVAAEVIAAVYQKKVFAQNSSNAIFMVCQKRPQYKINLHFCQCFEKNFAQLTADMITKCIHKQTRIIYECFICVIFCISDPVSSRIWDVFGPIFWSVFWEFLGVIFIGKRLSKHTQSSALCYFFFIVLSLSQGKLRRRKKSGKEHKTVSMLKINVFL